VGTGRSNSKNDGSTWLLSEKDRKKAGIRARGKEAYAVKISGMKSSKDGTCKRHSEKADTTFPYHLGSGGRKRAFA